MDPSTEPTPRPAGSKARPEGEPGSPPEFLPATPAETVPGVVPRPRPRPWTTPGVTGPDRGSIPGPAGSALRGRLASDPRLPGWIWRGVASAVAGVMVSAVASWRLGLTVAAVVAIADTIHRSRVSAALPASIWAPSAHRRTRRRLARLSRAGYRTLHARTAPGSQCVIDHLVIGPGGVYTVDAERWDRRLPVVRATKGGKLYHGPFSQADRLAHARQAAGEAGRLVGAALGEELVVQPTMAIYGAKVPWVFARISGVDVFGGRRLRRYLRQDAKARSAAWLDAEQIERIHAAAAEVLPPAR